MNKINLNQQTQKKNKKKTRWKAENNSNGNCRNNNKYCRNKTPFFKFLFTVDV
jgi:hypothetical protein